MPRMVSDSLLRILSKASSSLVGNILFFQVFGSIPFALLFLVQKQDAGVLDLSSALDCILAGVAFGLFAGIFSWFVVRRTISKRRS